MERWLPIPGLEGSFEVSDNGNFRPPLNVTQYETKPGSPRYWRVYLPAPVVRTWYVHRLVLSVFEGPCPPGMQCRHLNGNADDNRLENLQWGTPTEDNHDRVRHGTHQHTTRTRCPKDHPLDGIRRRRDGSIKQRYCKTCASLSQKRRKAKKTRCDNGHPFDGVRYSPDGSVHSRYCSICVSKQLAAGNATRWGASVEKT